jgi:capsular polysaccharide biosynthesis protein
MNMLARIIARLRGDNVARLRGDSVARLRARSVSAPSAVPPQLQRRLADAVRRGERAQVIALADEILAQAPDDAAALLAAAVNRLKTGDAPRAAAHFARLDELKSDGANSARLLREAWMDPERAARGEPYVATLHEAMVDADFWAVIDGDRIYTRETQARTVANSPRVRGRVTPDRAQCVMTLPCAPRRIEAPCILLGSDGNYAHWVLRNLLKLSLLAQADLAAGLPYLVGDPLRPWQSAYLELLGIPEARLLRVPAEAVVVCRELHVPTQLRNHPHMAAGIDWLRARVAAHRVAPPAGEGALLYASRREQSNRRLLNEAEVEALLAGLGFRIAVPGEMSVPEQIAAFSRARVVVAPHGAGLANMVFAPPGATLVEITSSAILHMDEFRMAAQAGGQQVKCVVSDDLGPARPGGGPEMHRDYRVDLAALRAALDEVLAP